MKTWLVLDVPYLAFRAFYSTPELGFQGIPTGVLFGVFRAMRSLQDEFCTNNIIFTFDHGTSLRKQLYPNYKSNRASNSLLTEENQKKIEVKRQTELLKQQYLTDLGYANVFWQHGYEADDIIAWLANKLSKKDSVIIVSADKDLYQVLNANTIIWDPKKKQGYGEKDLLQEWEVTPKQWVDVKALAGCTTDNIKGVVGVGEKTACLYVNGQHDKIRRKEILTTLGESKELRTKNTELVKLPMKGTGPFTIREDTVTDDKWRELLLKLGMKKLASELGVKVSQGRLF